MFYINHLSSFCVKLVECGENFKHVVLPCEITLDGPGGELIPTFTDWMANCDWKVTDCTSEFDGILTGLVEYMDGENGNATWTVSLLANNFSSFGVDLSSVFCFFALA